MARKTSQVNRGFVFFDVVYEDGTRSSRRRVSTGDLPSDNGDTHAMTLIMAQDRKIAEVSGHDRGSIREITRSSP